MEQSQNALKIVTDRMSQKTGMKRDDLENLTTQSDGTNRTAKTKVSNVRA